MGIRRGDSTPYGFSADLLATFTRAVITISFSKHYFKKQILSAKSKKLERGENLSNIPLWKSGVEKCEVRERQKGVCRRLKSLRGSKDQACFNSSSLATVFSVMPGGRIFGSLLQIEDMFLDPTQRLYSRCSTRREL